MNNVKKIIYNCRKATLLVEKQQLTSLTLGERMELKLHLAGCSVCRTFQRQSIMITRQIKILLHSSAKEEHKLNDHFKGEMQRRIEDKLKKS